MQWLEGKTGNKGGRPMPSPRFPAVSVRVYKEKKSGTAERLALFLNAAFVKAAMLQPGDRLAIGFDSKANAIGLIRNPQGNAISGDGWSIGRNGKPTKGKNTTPYVSYGLKAYPEVEAWAKARLGRWVRMVERDVFFESSDASNPLSAQ